MVDTGCREQSGLRDNYSRRAGDYTDFDIYPGNHDGNQQKKQTGKT